MGHEPKTPLISILMSVHNERPDYLETALSSILDQAYSDYDFLITDDASNAETAKILKKWAKQDHRIQLFHNPVKRGLTLSLNQMLHEAKGSLIARMDSDDISEPNRLTTQVKFLNEHPDTVLCGSWATIINQVGTVIGSRQPVTGYRKIRKLIVVKNPFIHSSWLARTSAIKAVGGYNPKMKLVQDYDLVLRLAANQPVDIIPEPLVQYREQPDSLSFQKMRVSLGFALQARWNALTKYGYPAWMAVYLVKPCLSYLVPIGLKKYIYNLNRSSRLQG